MKNVKFELTNISQTINVKVTIRQSLKIWMWYMDVNIMYFSATGTTKKIIKSLTNNFLEIIESKIKKEVDFTLIHNRKEGIDFNKNDILFIGVPVYAGRVPNILLKYLNKIKGNGALVVPIVVYGNRNYDDALIELNDIVKINGFKVIATASFIGEHSFSRSLGKNRPDLDDLEIIKVFTGKIYKKLLSVDFCKELKIPGNQPYNSYYKPKDEDGNYLNILKVKPKTNDNCIDCKICFEVCPMNSINYEDVSQISGICIKCGACIKRCPENAKYYDDKKYLIHKEDLEKKFICRCEPELFIRGGYNE